MLLTNLEFGTHPLVVHCGGLLYPLHERNWRPIKEAFFASPPRNLGLRPELGIITFNNGHEAMGVLERSLDHLGLPCLVLGQELEQWNSAIDKPRLTVEALERLESPYVLAVDSRDGLVDDPALALERFWGDFDCDLLFSADVISYPPIRRFQLFEEGLPGADQGRYRYLVAGAWMGRRDFALEFFREVSRRPPLPEAPRSEQGILRQLFLERPERICLDYRCRIFQNVGFLMDRLVEIG